MLVQFEILLPEERLVNEQELKQNFEALKPALQAIDSPYGSLRFLDPEHGQQAALFDTLEYLVVQICVKAVPNLQAGKEVVVDYFSSPERIRLTPEGNEVVLSVNGAPKGRFSQVALAPALHACAQRYSDYLRQLHGDNPQWGDRLALFDTAVNALAAK